MFLTRPSWDDTWLAVADVVARRSRCVRDQVGAVIVDNRNRIVATGYNGPPAGMKFTDPDGDVVTEVGCGVWCPRAGQRKHTGWKISHNPPTRYPTPNIKYENGTAYVILGTAHQKELTLQNAASFGVEPTYEDLSSDYSDCPSLHAEANALSVCDRSVREDGTIYITSGICFGCAKLVANSGLKRVVVRSGDDAHRQPDKSYKLLEDCGLEVYVR